MNSLKDKLTKKGTPMLKNARRVYPDIPLKNLVPGTRSLCPPGKVSFSFKLASVWTGNGGVKIWQVPEESCDIWVIDIWVWFFFQLLCPLLSFFLWVISGLSSALRRVARQTFSWPVAVGAFLHSRPGCGTSVRSGGRWASMCSHKNLRNY